LLVPAHETPYNQVDKGIVAEMDSAARQAASNQPAAVREALLPPPPQSGVGEDPRTPAEPRSTRGQRRTRAAGVHVDRFRHSLQHGGEPGSGGRLSLNLKDVTGARGARAIRGFTDTNSVDGTRIYVEAPDADAGVPRQLPVQPAHGPQRCAGELRSTSGTIGASQWEAGREPRRLRQVPGRTERDIIGLGQLNQVTNDVTRVSTFSQSDFWQELTTALRTLVGTGAGRSIVVSRSPA